MLIPLALTAAGLEALGAAAVFGLIKLVGDRSYAAAVPGLAAVARWSDGRATVVAAAVAVALFYLFKNAFLIAVAALQSRVISESIVSVSRRMLQGYLASPFVSHLRRNSAELIRNSTHSVQTAFREVMEPTFAAVTEACIAAAIVLVLMLKAPLLTLIASIALGGALTVTVVLTRRAIAAWGREEQVLRGRVLQTLQQAFHGLKEIKIRGRERFYYEGFSRQQHALARVLYLNATVSTVSRLLIETVFICGVLLVIVLATLGTNTAPDIVPLLGLYAYAGFRVIPSVNRIVAYIGRVQYGSAAVDALYEDFRQFPDVLDEPVRDREPGLTFADRFVLSGVGFSYGPQLPALQAIDLTVLRGQSVGIVGPTGAGKSTLIDVILGLLRPSEGRITVDGTDIFAALRSWQSKIGYVPQMVYLTDDTLRRNVAFGLGDDEIDDEKLHAALRMAQLENFTAALPDGLDTVVGERGTRLSGGERQRVAIARALYHEPELLVFDEATAALDSHTERELTRAIESLRGKKTLLIIAHRLSTVRSCDRLVLLRAGRIEAEGSFDELVARDPHFRTLARADLG